MNKRVLFTSLALTASLVSVITPAMALADTQSSLKHPSAATGDYIQPGLIVHMPPQNFDPLTAPKSELAQYGLPSRPTDPSKLQEWKQAFGTVTHWIKPTFTLTNIKLDDPDQHWSGLSYINPNTPATRVVGWWTQPWASVPTQYRPAYSATWIGLGGSAGDSLIQGGTESYIKSNGLGTYSAVYQILGTTTGSTPNAVTVNGLNNNPGDQMYCDISYVKGTANFYYHDITNGNATSFSVTGITGYNSFGEVDWITERPVINGSNTQNMANYGSVTFTAEEGTPSSVSYPTVNSFNDSYFYVTQDGTTSSDTLSKVTSYLNSTGNFTTSWVNYN